MRTLHLAATFGQGGIATSLWHLLPVLNKLPENQVDAAAFYEVGWFGTLLEADGVSIYPLQMAFKYDFRVLIKLVRLFKSYDVIHAHGWPVIFFVALASLFSGDARFIVTEHSVTNGRRRPYLRWFDRLLYSRFDQVVAVSQAVADSLRLWQPQIKEKITVIYNGINMTYFNSAESKTEMRLRLNLQKERPVIFASGNFRYAKGFDLLLESMRALIEMYRREDMEDGNLPVLLIAGEGALQASMADLADELGIADHVRFLGFRTDMPGILKAADLFVLSSRWEGCPMVILEAMALCVPILATEVGGVPELIVHDQTGKLIPSSNPEALAEGLFALLLDGKGAGCLAEQGYQRLLQRFTIERSGQRLTNLYQQMMGYGN